MNILNTDDQRRERLIEYIKSDRRMAILFAVGCVNDNYLMNTETENVARRVCTITMMVDSWIFGEWDVLVGVSRDEVMSLLAFVREPDGPTRVPGIVRDVVDSEDPCPTGTELPPPGLYSAVITAIAILRSLRGSIQNGYIERDGFYGSRMKNDEMYS